MGVRSDNTDDRISALPSSKASPRVGGLDRVHHLDGLRALAILAVVGHHLNLPGFAGGFVGVDVFFVLSGFLIIGQILDRLDTGHFSLLEFWVRRALRILPAYFLMLLAMIPLAIHSLVTPRDWEYFGLSGGLAAVFGSNIYFLFKQGYFDFGASEKPFLHTWSLSVEEQFYLVAPLLLMAIYWYARRLGWASGRLLSLLGYLIAGSSLAGCLAFTEPPGSRNPAFYLIPFRAWEFILGASVYWLARGPWRHRWTRSLEYVGLLGLATLLGAVILAPGAHWYPGFGVLAPAVGSWAIIAAGRAAPYCRVARLLALPPLAGLGALSYGWYLWHWPLLCLSRLNGFHAPDLGRDAGMALVALGLAAASYRWVEQPVINWRRQAPCQEWSRKVLLVSCTGCLTLMVLVGGTGALLYLRAKGHPALRVDPVLLAVSRGEAPSARASGAGPVSGLLIGDSHADQLLEVLRREGAAVGVAELTRIDWRCPGLGRAVGVCEELTRPVEAQEGRTDRDLQFVVVARRWNGYIPHYNHQRGNGFYESELRRELEILSGGGRRRLLVIAPLPEFRLQPDRCILWASDHAWPWSLCAVPRNEVEADRAPILATLREILAGLPNARLVDPMEDFCDVMLCRPYIERSILFRDDNHLNRFGADWLCKQLRSDLLWAFTGETQTVDRKAMEPPPANPDQPVPDPVRR